MIHTLHLQRFKGHRATSVRLRPMTLLVGPNGSGKTSVLEALDALGAGRFPWADEATRYGANVHRGERDAITLRAEGDEGDHAATLALVVGPSPPPDPPSA